MGILPDISKSKNNEAMKVGHLIEHNVKIIFFKNYTENEAGRLAQDLFLLF